MKKGMLQLMVLFVVLHAHAMEIVQQNPSIPCNNTCYLNYMPLEILNYIASFLMEAEEDFVARTLAEKKKKDAMYADKRHHEVRWPNAHLSLRCSNRGIVLNGDGSRLAMRDGLKDVRKGMYVTKLESSTYDCCALSPNGTNIAVFHRKFETGQEYRTGILELLKIRIEDVPEQHDGNLIIEERQEIFRGDDKVYFRSIAFNQQGWQLIGWRLSSNDTVDKRNYRIFLLPIDWLPANQLQVYLKDKFVYNKCIEGKK
jgi:hypothetical protein